MEDEKGKEVEGLKREREAKRQQEGKAKEMETGRGGQRTSQGRLDQV
jgi:hypothetical protein